MFVGKEGLVGDEMVSGHLGQGDHELLGLSVLSEVRRGTSRISILDFGKQTLACLGHSLTKSLPSQS